MFELAYCRDCWCLAKIKKNKKVLCAIQASFFVGAIGHFPQIRNLKVSYKFLCVVISEIIVYFHTRHQTQLFFLSCCCVAIFSLVTYQTTFDKTNMHRFTQYILFVTGSGRLAVYCPCQSFSRWVPLLPRLVHMSSPWQSMGSLVLDGVAEKNTSQLLSPDKQPSPVPNYRLFPDHHLTSPRLWPLSSTYLCHHQ